MTLRSRRQAWHSPPITMIEGSTANHVFKISELARVIAGQLALISQKSAVGLAYTCRDLEGPVLSTLWEKQCSFENLMKVLPEGSWNYEDPGAGRFATSVCGLDHSFEESDS